MKQKIQINTHDGQQFAFYKNALGHIPFPASIHPGPRDRSRNIKKRQNHQQNLQARSAANQARSASKNNPNWHGIGRHAGVKTGH